MLLTKNFEVLGNYLFRWRSYLPLILVMLFLSALPYYSYPLGSHLLDIIWEIFCLAISLFGLLIRIITVGYTPKRTSGRNTKKGQVADYLNISGMYSIVRNPLYLGNFFVGLGVSLFLRIWWVSFIYALVFLIYYERIIIAEEAFLARKFKQPYMEWVSKTPAFFPKFSQWHTPELPFSIKKAIRKEYHGFLAIILSMFALELVSDFYLHRYFKFDFVWKCFVGLGVIAYVIIRFVHKKTSILKTPGR